MQPTHCPSCNADFTGEPIPVESQEAYGYKTHFSRLIGIEIPGKYDGVSIWKCPDCGCEWERFKKLQIFGPVEKFIK